MDLPPIQLSDAGARADRVSPMRLATIVAALHVVILATRMHGRHMPCPIMCMSWQTPAVAHEPVVAPVEPPSNPRQTYAVGQLALAVGMAVMTLTRWLHVMHVRGSRTH